MRALLLKTATTLHAAACVLKRKRESQREAKEKKKIHREAFSSVAEAESTGVERVA
jgi:hypothetical protein